jgi:hypothetical protein
MLVSLSALLSFGGCKKIMALATPPAPVVDTDYQFRLDSPGRGWTLLDEAAARKLVPDAVAGATLTGAGMQAQYGVVIIERYPGDLPSYATLVDQALQMEDKQVESSAKEDFEGRPAMRITTRGTRGGVRLLFQHVLFLHQGFGYQLIGWGLDGQVTGEKLRAFSSAFHLQGGTVRARRQQATLTEAHGPGWILAKGIFRSPAWGIAASPTAEARVLVGAELATMNSSAEVGLAGGSPDGFVVVLPEFVPAEIAHAIAKKRMRANVESLGLTGETEGFSVNTLGESVAMRRYEAKTQPIVYFQGAVVRGEHVFVLLAWQMKNASLDAGGGTLAPMVGSLRFLDEGERAQAAKDLAARGDSPRQVGGGFALHRGNYRNFDHGFSWQLPSENVRIYVGDAAREQTASALLVLDDVGTGLGGLLAADDAKGLSAADFHAARTDGIFEGRKGRATPPRKVELPGGPALSSEGNVVLAEIPMVKRVVTWVRENKGYRAILWGPRATGAKSVEKFDALLRGLALQSEPAVSVTDGTYVNRRFGFSYTPPASTGKRFERAERVPAEIASIGSVVEWKNDRHQVAVLALFDMDARMDDEMLLSRFRPQGGRALLTKGETTVDTMGGVSGKRAYNRSLAGGGHDLVLVRRHGVYYGLILEAVTGALAEADLAAFKAGFRFID